MLIFTFHLEKVRTETRTRHISSVISLYTFQGRIVMRIMRRILALVGRLFVTLVVNLCQSGQKWLKPSKVSNKLKKNKSWGISRRFWICPIKIQFVAVKHPENSKMSLNIWSWDFWIVICLISTSSLVQCPPWRRGGCAWRAQGAEPSLLVRSSKNPEVFGFYLYFVFWGICLLDQ